MPMRIILALLLSCFSALAQFNFSNPSWICQQAPPAGGGECNTVVQGNLLQVSSIGWFGETGPRKYLAIPFYATNSATVCKIDVVIRYGLDSGGTLTAAIHSNSANSPGSIIGSASGAVDITAFTSSFTTNTITISSSITASTTNWLVISTSFTTDYCYFGAVAAADGLLLPKISSDGSSWSDGPYNQAYPSLRIYQ